MLRKQLVPVNFGALDEKTESKALAPGTMTRVVNAERNKTGRYDKRTGYGSAYNASYLDTSGTTTASYLKALGTTGESLFALDADTSDGDFSFLGYSPGGTVLTKQGTFYPCTAKTKTLSANPEDDVVHITSAANAAYTCVAWVSYQDDAGWSGSTSYAVHAVVIDNKSGNIVADEIFDADGPCVAVAYHEDDDEFHVYINSGTNSVGGYYWGAGTNNFTGLGNVITDINGTYRYFIVKPYSTFLMFFYSDSGGLLQLSRSSGDSILTSLNNGNSGRNPRGLVFDDSNNAYCFYEDTSGNTDLFVMDTGGTVNYGPAAFVSNGGLVAGYSTGATSIYAYAVQESGNTPTVRSGSVSASSGGSVSALHKNCFVFSDGFSYNGKTYVTLLHYSETQATYFVVQEGTVVAKLLPKNGPYENPIISAPDRTAIPTPAVVGEISSSKFKIPLLKAVGLNTDGSSVVTRPGAAICEFEFRELDELQHVPLGDSALISGGYLALYDGKDIVENGFHLYPEITLAQSAGSGAIANGTYSYKALWEWTDANGRVHRSEPSVAASITTTGSNDIVTVTAQELTLTAKNTNTGGAEPVQVRLVIYRTTAGGSTYYRIPTPSASNYYEVQDGIADSAITDNEVLYTQGGEVANEQPPACGHVCTYKNRVWVTNLEDGSKAWYSKIRINNDDPYAFSENLQISVGDAERVIAAQALDDKLLFFKERRLLYTFGEGPNNLAQSGEFADPVDVNFDGGIAEAASLVKFPAGIIWKHQRGFYVMGGDLNPQYIGKAVEDFNDETVTSAVLIPSKNQIRWTHSAGSILAFDYFHQQWYEYSTLQCSGGTIRDGKHVVVSSNNIYEQDDSAWTDGGSSYNFLVQTGWISLGGLSGFKRVYKIFFEAQYKADHDLTITVDMEQDGTVYTDTYTVDAASVSGGTDTYRWEIALSRQKCSSIRVKIEDTNLAGTEQSLNIINMTMLVGLKVGGPKFASSKQIG